MTKNPPRYYPDVDPNPDFARIEEKILDFWQREKIFEASVEQRPAKKDGHSNEFIFYDGPPFANGLPHYGHLLTGFVKDVFARYQTMKGKRVERRFGWDCHGLPAEMGAEKELGISGRQAIINYGIGKFNEYCRESVMKYTKEWEYYVTRQGRWVDFKNDYKTMDVEFMESVLWAFKQLYDKGLVYEAYRVMPYSWAAETPLSNFEIRLDNATREREDKAITVAFELDEVPEFIRKDFPEIKTCKVLAWTTTPWTLPSNLALAVSKNFKYVAIPLENMECLIMAVDAIPRYIHGIQKIKDSSFGISVTASPTAVESGQEEFIRERVRKAVPGSSLLSLSYHPLFPYFDDEIRKKQNAFRILDGSEFVTDADGTGVVHMAPGFGEDDQRVCEANGIHIVVPVDEKGRYTDEIFDIPMNRPPLEGGQASAASREGYQKLAEHKYDQTTLQKAKELRESSTEAEYKLWSYLKGKQFEGHKFRRQQPIGPFIVDFYCADARLIIELDGGQHNEEKNVAYDAERSVFLKNAGYRVLRFWNIDVRQNIEAIGEKIFEAINTPPAPAFAVAALPQGEGEVLQLRGLNVIAETEKNPSEPYKDEQLKKYGLANLRIIDYLKRTGHLIKQEEIKHNYPHCWRTDTPIIYRALSSWYVAVTKFRDRAGEMNQQINWIPAHTKDGAMGHMLATAPDWSISRNRFWGTPIPIWRSKSGKIKVFGSIAELEKASGKKITDLHRPYIDDIVISEGGEEYRRVEEVFDCWFESGSMPYAQVHYPFENKDWFQAHFPADFITEYVGQTRGWFNTLIMLATGIFKDTSLDGRPPFKNCICHGVVIDEETGLKYSKRLKNYKDPKEVMDQFGADALRWLMVSSPVMRGMDLAVDPQGKFIRDVVRLAIKPIWNAYNFFCLYANADGVRAEFINKSESGTDWYALAKCRIAVEKIKKSLDSYDTPYATAAVQDFFEALNNWHIRRSKDRFWSDKKGIEIHPAQTIKSDDLVIEMHEWTEDHDKNKQDAYNTLFTVLHIMSRAIAPLLPFTTEAIYTGLVGKGSVHLQDFPDVSVIEIDNEKMKAMDWARDVCNTALSIRNAKNIRVRQPLKEIVIVGQCPQMSEELETGIRAIIASEVNVKKIRPGKYDIADYATLKLQLNNPIIGKRLPEKMKQIIPASKKGEWKQLPDGNIEICGEKLQPGEFTLQLEPKPEYKDRAQALSTNDALVILDTTITPELEAEGIARDVVRMIQQARKDAGLHVSDRIALQLETPPSMRAAVKSHEKYIAEQTLAVSVKEGAAKSAAFHVENMLDGETFVIGLSKAA